MIKISNSRAFLPNSFTALNALCGFLSIISASHNDFYMSALFIFGGALFDIFDGLIARILGSTSRLGVELDSLSDVISFGVAPSFLIYQSYLNEFGAIGVVISSFPMLFGAFRLARFNIQIEDITTKLDFKGLPIPISAILLASLVLFYHNGVKIISPFSYMIIPLILILSFLMVSKIRYNAFPNLKKLNTFTKILLIAGAIIALALLVITNGVAFFYILLAMVFGGILRHIFYLLFDLKKTALSKN
ncbi:MAG: CDP-diacylglycerol--serine O-phosphatidyltransferase [Bacteroidetes bacterium]|nr:CDP-diacylglycerol--serine O-phosphatidyltransferase [Bacteroidota bacterium]